MKREDICRIFSNIPSLKTDRLILRKITLDDIEDMYEYSSDPEVTELLTWYPHPDKTHTLEYISYLQTRYRTGDFYDWAVVWRDTGKMIGTCGFTRFDFPNNCAEIGYALNREYHGLGIATEALGAVIEFGFSRLGLNRIEGKYISVNTASRRVMEKNGMIFEGIRREGMLIKKKYRDIGTLAILKSDYAQNCKKGNL